jgi:hypothetical protein
MDDRKDKHPAPTDDAAHRVNEAVGNAASDIKAAAGSAIKDAKSIAMQKAEDVRAQASDTGHTTASRLRELAGQVEGDLPWMATAFAKSADGLDSVTNSLTQGNLDECVSGLSDFARRQPAIFLGASVALGFALSRIGKTALEDARPSAGALPRDAEPAAQPFDAASTAYPRPTGV